MNKYEWVEKEGIHFYVHADSGQIVADVRASIFTNDPTIVVNIYHAGVYKYLDTGQAKLHVERLIQ